MEPLLTVQQLSRRFADKAVVKEVTFTLNAGDVLGFLGPNGAGKSTTMRMISGSLAPTRGQVRICSLDLLEDPRAAKACLGFLPETPPLYPDLTIKETLRFAGELHGLRGNALEQACAKVMALCRLNDFPRRLIANLSKGYQQRVGIAQALIHDPRVLILDEPTSGLDPKQIREIRALIAELAKTKAIMLCSHILPEIETLCNRVIILHQGRVVLNSPMESFDQGTEQVILELGNVVDRADLTTLSGVVKAEDIQNNRFRLQLAEPADTPALASAVVERGWELKALFPEQTGLEHRFIQLTSSEEQTGC